MKTITFIFTALIALCAFAELCGEDTTKTEANILNQHKMVTSMLEADCDKKYKLLIKKNPSLKLCVENEDQKPSKEYIERLKLNFAKLDQDYDKIKNISKPKNRGTTIAGSALFYPELNVNTGNYNDYIMEDITRLKIEHGESSYNNQDFSFRNLTHFKNQKVMVSVTSPLHETIDEAKLSQAEAREYKDLLINKMANFATKRKCITGQTEIKKEYTLVKVPDESVLSLGLKPSYTSTSEFNKVLSQNKEALLDAFYKEHPKDKELENNRFCKPVFDQRKWKLAGRINFECNATLTKTFDANSSDVDELSLEDSEGYKKFNECLERMKSKGYELKEKIKISASASKTNNNLQKSGYCPWDFKGLASARANNTLAILKEKYNVNSNDFAVEIHGNGSSGPCPYKESNGRRVFKKKFSSKPQREKLLEPYRKVVIKAQFEPKYSSASSQGAHAFQLVCQGIGMSCKNDSSDSEKQFNRVKRGETFYTPPLK